ncbi:MAG: cyclase family protein [Planctomycetes bacterium]|nr:cyclase family protein [Planctomycetota bacterium]
MIHDISVRLDDQAMAMPNDVAFQRRFFKTIAAGASCNQSMLTMSIHRGTHVDTPLHFIEGGKALKDYPLERFVLPAVVVEAPRGLTLGPEALEGADVRPGDAVLFKTDNSRAGWSTSGVFRTEYAAVTLKLAMRLIELGASMAGLDYPTIEIRGDRTYPVHKALLGSDILILEGINLVDVISGRYTLSCLPLPLVNAEASPVRAVLSSPA